MCLIDNIQELWRLISNLFGCFNTWSLWDHFCRCFVCSVNTPKEIRPLKSAPEANPNWDSLERWSEVGSLEFHWPVPFFWAVWTQTSPGSLLIITAPHTRLLQHRFLWHIPSQREKMMTCRYVRKKKCCFWLLISDAQTLQHLFGVLYWHDVLRFFFAICCIKAKSLVNCYLIMGFE